MQTAPPSRIMLGGAVLNPDSAIPRQLSVCGGAIRFNGQRQLRRRRSLGASAPVPPCAEASAAHSGLPRWQDLLFIRLSRSANDATDYFRIPTGRVVEVGTQVTIQGREPHKFRLNCRRTATASLFLGRNRTSDSTRIPVWISLLKPGVGGSKFYPAGRRARMPAAFYVGLCSEARAEALSGKIFRCDGLIL